MAQWVQKVISKWLAEKVNINVGASRSEIESLENILHFEFPNDFKDFYLMINGFKSFDMEEHMFTFWPLETIIEEYNTSEDKDFIGFSDYLIASHAIGFKKSKKGIYKCYQSLQNDLTPIAETFEEVVAMINSDSPLIY